MRYKTFGFIFALLMPTGAFAQERRDIFNSATEITWLGVDFSEAKFIGDREKLGSESDIRHLLDAINELMIKEADKYNVAAALQRKKVDNATQVTAEHNSELDVLAMLSNDGKDHIHLKPDGVEQIIASYDFKGLSGIGVMINVESLNKLIDEGSFWVTFVNMGTRELLMTERIVAPPTGFGLRNFWAGAINGALIKIKKKEFEAWRKRNT